MRHWEWWFVGLVAWRCAAGLNIGVDSSDTAYRISPTNVWVYDGSSNRSETLTAYVDGRTALGTDAIYEAVVTYADGATNAALTAANAHSDAATNGVGTAYDSRWLNAAGDTGAVLKLTGVLAQGGGATASGSGSAVLAGGEGGAYSLATNAMSVAIIGHGSGTIAGGYKSLAINGGSAGGSNSFAFYPQGTAAGEGSVAFGGQSYGKKAFATGDGHAYGNYSFACADGHTYTGVHGLVYNGLLYDAGGSFAAGYGNAYGNHSAAICGTGPTDHYNMQSQYWGFAVAAGRETAASGHYSFAVGAYSQVAKFATNSAAFGGAAVTTPDTMGVMDFEVQGEVLKTLNMGGQSISNLGAAVDATGAVPKSYVDGATNAMPTTAYVDGGTNEIAETLNNALSAYGVLYFLGGEASDIAGYSVMASAPGTGTENVITNAAVTNGQYLARFVTASNFPGLTEIQRGNYKIHAHLRMQNKNDSCTFKAEAYLLDVDGTELFEIEDTEVSVPLTEAIQNYELTVPLPTNVVSAVTNRWAIKLKVVTQTGTPDIYVYTQSNRVSYLEGNAGPAGGVSLETMEYYVDGATGAMPTTAYVDGATGAMPTTAYVDGATNAIPTTAYVDGATNACLQVLGYDTRNVIVSNASGVFVAWIRDSVTNLLKMSP